MQSDKLSAEAHIKQRQEAGLCFLPSCITFKKWRSTAWCFWATYDAACWQIKTNLTDDCRAVTSALWSILLKLDFLVTSVTLQNFKTAHLYWLGVLFGSLLLADHPICLWVLLRLHSWPLQNLIRTQIRGRGVFLGCNYFRAGLEAVASGLVWCPLESWESLSTPPVFIWTGTELRLTQLRLQPIRTHKRTHKNTKIYILEILSREVSCLRFYFGPMKTSCRSNDCVYFLCQ